MESGTSKKRKVVWLCHFANQDMIRLFNASRVREFAPWIDLLIKAFEPLEDTELHIISPNVFSNEDHNVTYKQVHYYFYQYHPSYFPRKIYNYLSIDPLTNFHFIRRKITGIVDGIHPDIIHLHGAENPYYSAAILPLNKKYRTLVTVQGFISHTTMTKKTFSIRNRISIERRIIRECENFGVRTDFMEKEISKINPGARMFRHGYPVRIPKVQKNDHQKQDKYDCVFFARISKDKGIEDLIRATAQVKKSRKDVSVNVIGTVNPNYGIVLKTLCHDLNITENVHFSGFLRTQEELFNEVIRAKICVLPSYFEIIPGTIIESMLMKVPVIAYNVGGIPEMNNGDDCLVLVDKGNIHDLAGSILRLLTDPGVRTVMAEKAYQKAHQLFSSIDRMAGEINNIYKQIIQGSSQGDPHHS